VHLKGVAEMTSKDRFPNHETICGQCGTTIYKPFKQLSDKEIIEIGNAVVNLIDSNEGWIEFARAILKKASEK
jgi:hypothetical protein